MADTFISLANSHSDTVNRENVGMALLYAASRYNAFVVASNAKDVQSYVADQEKAMEFFSGQYKDMLQENLDDYQKVIANEGKYSHLVKKH